MQAVSGIGSDHHGDLSEAIDDRIGCCDEICAVEDILEAVGASDRHKEDEIMEHGRFRTLDVGNIPDLASTPPWAYEDGNQRKARECRPLLVACQFGLARVQLVITATLARGDYGANMTIQYMAWHNRDYDTSPRPRNEKGEHIRRTPLGSASYRDLEDQYGIPRCSIERAYERLVAAILPGVQNGVYKTIGRTLSKGLTRDLGPPPWQADACSGWLERLWWSLGDLHEVLLRRCPSQRTSRDPVRAVARRLICRGGISACLAGSFKMPRYQTDALLDDEYEAIETVVGRDRMDAIMDLLAVSLDEYPISHSS